MLEELEAILQKEDVEIQKVLEVTNDPALQAGENYTSEISRTRVKVLKTSGDIETLPVIIKYGIPGHVFGEMELFRIEIKMYKEVLSEMENIFKSHPKNAEILWPRCLGTRPNDRVILEDMTPKGYKMIDRLKRLDLEHARVVLQSLGRFHAASVVLQDKGMLDVSDLHIFYVAEPKHVNMHQMLKKNMITLSSVMKESWGPEWTDVSARVLKVAHEFQEKVLKICEVDDSSFNVLNHGDLWSNNMLFKYCDTTGQLKNIKILDYQLSHYNTPSPDILYFLNMALPTRLMLAHYDELLRVYHASLVENCKAFDHVPSNLFTLEQLQKDMEDKMYLGLIVSIAIQPIIQSERGEAVDFTDILKESLSDTAKSLYQLKHVEDILKLALPMYVQRGVL